MSKINHKKERFSLLVCWILFLITLVLVFVKQKWSGYHVIVWDIRAYYAYLPAAFIERDLSLSFLSDHPEWAEQRYWPNPTKDGGYVIKMTMGMSFIYLPYFIIGHLWALLDPSVANDGFSVPYQIMLCLSGPVNMLLGLLALRRFLKAYFSELIVGLSLILLIAGTNAAHYVYEEGPMSHIHNFMLYAFFLRLTQLWHKSPSWRDSIYLGLVSGLIALIRPNNVLVAFLFIFYNISNWSDLTAKLQLYLQHWKKLFILLFIAFLILCPQLCYWKYITDQWVYYSYQNNNYVERFFFDRPRFALGLFSYSKGWLIYTPLGFFAIIGIFMLYQKVKAWKWIVPFFIFMQFYVILSWWNWWYGGGFSQRAFIDLYPVLALGIAAFLHWMNENRIFKYSFGMILVLLVCLNMFQTWQYSQRIIRWSGMSRQAYWSVFLKTKKPPNFDDLIKEHKRDAALRGEVDFWGPDSLRCF